MTVTDVVTPLGRIRGRTVNGVDVFKGIRYAQAPAALYRWQPPRPVTPWKGLYEALQMSPGCPQQPFPRRTGAAISDDEDCLCLNLWRPQGSQQGDDLPVMVWLHGGGFISGSASPPRYDGTAFARSGVIMVSLDYRIGRLGFFAHPALEDAPLRGNYGLMDQIEALRWVQTHIQAFGGNLDNVTVFGESAGGMSIVALLTSSYAKGLFHKAIIQSGGGRHIMVPGNDWPSAVERTLALAKHVGVPADGSAASLALLRALPAKQLVKGLDMSTLNERPGYCGPMIDGVILEDEPCAQFQRGAFHRIPLIIGTTDADLGIAPRVTTLDDALAHFKQHADLWASAHQQLRHLPPQRVAQRLASDRMMDEPARFVARTFAAHGVPVWRYRFGYVPEKMADGASGAPHGGEIEFVFDTLAHLHTPATARDQQVATQMHRYWVAFAHSGRPEAPGLPSWVSATADSDRLLVVPAAGASNTATVPDEWQARLDLAMLLAASS